MMLILFYVLLAAMLYGVWSMTRMHTVILRHRHDLVARLVNVTDAVPPAERDDWHQGNAALLDAQLLELEALRPWWWRTR